MNNNETNNKNTDVQVAAPAPELDLFQHSTPKTTGGLVITERKSEVTGKVTGRALVLPKRKDLATKLGVNSKDGAVTAEMRKLGDMILALGIAEFQAGAAANQLTGARFAKSASGRITMSAVPVEKRLVTTEQMQAAFMAMTPAERKAFMALAKQNVNGPTGQGITIEANTGKPAKKGKKTPTPAKAAAKTDEQPKATEAQTPEQPAAEPAIDNLKAEPLPEATVN